MNDTVKNPPATDLWTAAKAEKNWLVFELRTRPDPSKLDKVPVSPHTGQSEDFKKAALTFEEARKIVEQQNAARGFTVNTPGALGTGYVPRPGSALVGVDIDNAFESDGSLKPHIKKLIEDGETYVEKSPSGTGLRALIARREGDEKVSHTERNKVGFFANGKGFFSVTDDPYGPRRSITDAPELRRKVLARLQEGKADPPTAPEDGGQSVATGGNQAAQEPSRAPWRGVPPARRSAALEDALRHVEPVDDRGGYDDGAWVKIGAAIKSAAPDIGEPAARAIFDDWAHNIGGDTSQNEKRWSSFSPSRQGGATVATIFSLAEQQGWRAAKHVFDAIENSQGQPKATGRRRLVLSGQPVGQAVLVNRPPPPKVLVNGLIPCGPFTWVGPGGVSKTTTAIKALIHIILGRPLWGRTVQHSGPVVMLSREDPSDVVYHRLHRVCAAMGLSPQDQNAVAEQFYFEDLTEAGEAARLVRSDRNANFEYGEAIQSIIETYRSIDPAIVMLDPAIHFGPGERYINDGEAALASAAWNLSKKLNGAAVGLIHHVSQDVARNRISDQYAGRGGTAGADNARAVLVQHSVKEVSPDLPQGVAPDSVLSGRVSRIRAEKFSYGARAQEDLYVVRDATDPFSLDFVPGDPSPTTPAEQQARAARRKAQEQQEATGAVLEHVRVRVADGGHPTKTAVRDELTGMVLPSGGKLTQKKCTNAIERLVDRGELEEAPLPDHERQGRRQTFLRLYGAGPQCTHRRQ